MTDELEKALTKLFNSSVHLDAHEWAKIIRVEVAALEASASQARAEVTNLENIAMALRPPLGLNTSIDRIAAVLERFDKVLLTPGEANPNYGLLERLVDFIATIQRQTGG